MSVAELNLDQYEVNVGIHAGSKGAIVAFGNRI